MQHKRSDGGGQENEGRKHSGKHHFIDYHYWGKYGTGSHKFDETIFPDVPAMVDSLHNIYDLKVVLTMWPSFKPGIPNYNEMSERGYILEGARAIDGYIYDTFNPGAAKMYWDKVVPLVDLNIDGWFWMDRNRII